MRKRLMALIRDQSLKGASFRSGFWTIWGFGMQSALRLGSNLILTRILAPDMFGLMALALTFVTGVSLMSDVGTRHSVIRSTRGEEDEFLTTAWTVQVARGVLITVIACALAWPAAWLYDQPELFAVLCALSVVSIFDGLKSIAMATTSRKMELGRQTMVTLASQVLMIAVMITAAFILESVWALVIGSIVGSASRALFSHLFLTPFRHRLRLEPEALREIITFGRWVLLGTFFNFLGGRGITAVHGALVPLDILGILSVSTVLIRALETLVQKLLSAVGFPAFSKVLRERPQDLPRLLARVRNRLLTVCVLGFVAISYLAQPLIDFLYDDRYAFAGGFLAVQALNGALRVLARPYQDVMLAEGDSRLHSMVMFFSAAGGILGTVAGYYLFGLYGMIAGMGVAALVVFAISTSFAYRRGYADLRFDFVIVASILVLYAIIIGRQLI
jgi:O-antigen/teichoic acid export membrane protein